MKKLLEKLFQTTDLYAAIGYLTCLAAFGHLNSLWLQYYTFRVKLILPHSEGSQLEELKLRVRSCLGEVVDTTFWELISKDNGYALAVTYPHNVMWSEESKTFIAPDYESAVDFCVMVLGVKYTDIYPYDMPEITIEDIII